VKIYVSNDGTTDWKAIQEAYTTTSGAGESKCDNCQRHKLGSELLQIDGEVWCLNCLINAVKAMKQERNNLYARFDFSK
jgi:hypothetical protein